MAGKQIIEVNGEYIFRDYTPGIFTSSVVVGSVIKGASQIVGYNTGALTIGEKRYDNCVKLKSAPLKCSWKYLGLLDDITALKQSSNTYQFYTALKVAGATYYYDMPFQINNNAFEIYRNTFKEFGLGVKTGIDLPNEFAGLQGKNETGGLLLDFAIGQYDNYTPLQLAQYISTIANNGTRMKFYLLQSVYEAGSNLEKEIYHFEPVVLNNVTTSLEYLKRVQEGFQAVLDYGGTGSGYIDKAYLPAGKTGTSQSFVDTDNDGIVDTETVSNTFVGYAPYNDPTVTFTVVSPDTYDYATTYQTSVNKRITKRISQKYFELYG
jgi:cell division protein FtsI/penicillin-binding protein 2